MDITKGVITPMITPFNKDGVINENQVRLLVDFLINRKVNGIFPVSTVGEFIHLNVEEKKYLIELVIDESRNRVPIIAGVTSSCPQKAIELAKFALEKGASAIISSAPYYFMHSQEVIKNYFNKLAYSVDIPIILYNIPRFVTEISLNSILELAQNNKIIGLKDSSGNIVSFMNIVEATRKVNKDFMFFTGSDETIFPALIIGGNGCATAGAGVFPELIIKIFNSFNNGDTTKALEIQKSLLPLVRMIKSIDFPEGWKLALSLRDTEVGSTKMVYSDKFYEKRKLLAKKIKCEMIRLLKLYSPESSFSLKN
jgi:4-hydroxy-tetrahydrodipicolinate synthase